MTTSDLDPDALERAVDAAWNETYKGTGWVGKRGLMRPDSMDGFRDVTAAAIRALLASPAGAWRRDFENAPINEFIVCRSKDAELWLDIREHKFLAGFFSPGGEAAEEWFMLPMPSASPAPPPATPPAEARELVETPSPLVEMPATMVSRMLGVLQNAAHAFITLQKSDPDFEAWKTWNVRARDLELELRPYEARRGAWTAEGYERFAKAVVDESIANRDATIERLERQMLEWRICAQEITPGGSEFMAPEAVRGYQRDLKNRYHAAKCEVVLLQRQLAALSPASAKTAEDR